jgi:hypothetical protein
MTTGQPGAGAGEGNPANQAQGVRVQEPSEVTIAKINRSSAIAAAVITGVVTLTGGIITAIVTYNVGVQHGSQAASNGNAVVASDTDAAFPTSVDMREQTQTTASRQISNHATAQSLLGMTQVGDPSDIYQSGPETINTKPYQQTLYTRLNICGGLDDTITYQPERKYTHFHALVGLTDDSESGVSVTFDVETPDNTSTTPIGNTATIGVAQDPRPVDADIPNDSRITLRVHIAGSDCHQVTAVWIDPTLQ